MYNDHLLICSQIDTFSPLYRSVRSPRRYLPYCTYESSLLVFPPVAKMCDHAQSPSQELPQSANTQIRTVSSRLLSRRLFTVRDTLTVGVSSLEWGMCATFWSLRFTPSLFPCDILPCLLQRRHIPFPPSFFTTRVVMVDKRGSKEMTCGKSALICHNSGRTSDGENDKFHFWPGREFPGITGHPVFHSRWALLSISTSTFHHTLQVYTGLLDSSEQGQGSSVLSPSETEKRKSGLKVGFSRGTMSVQPLTPLGSALAGALGACFSNA